MQINDIHRDKVLDSYIGKNVSIAFIGGGDYIHGVLGYADKFSAEHGYVKPRHYYCGNYCFRKSHVRNIKEQPLEKPETKMNDIDIER